MGKDTEAAAAISTRKSFVMRVKMEPSLAPSTLRMPISLVRRAEIPRDRFMKLNLFERAVCDFP